MDYYDEDNVQHQQQEDGMDYNDGGGDGGEYQDDDMIQDEEGNNMNGYEEEDGEPDLNDEDIPVTQEDAWAVIRYVLFNLIYLSFVLFVTRSANVQSVATAPMYFLLFGFGRCLVLSLLVRSIIVPSVYTLC